MLNGNSLSILLKQTKLALHLLPLEGLFGVVRDSFCLGQRMLIVDFLHCPLSLSGLCLPSVSQ